MIQLASVIDEYGWMVGIETLEQMFPTDLKKGDVIYQREHRRREKQVEAVYEECNRLNLEAAERGDWDPEEGGTPPFDVDLHGYYASLFQSLVDLAQRLGLFFKTKQSEIIE